MLQSGGIESAGSERDIGIASHALSKGGIGEKKTVAGPGKNKIAMRRSILSTMPTVVSHEAQSFAWIFSWRS